MSLRAAVRSLSRRLGLVAGATETCPTCGMVAPAGTSEAPADGPSADARDIARCRQCRVPLASDGVLVRRYARGYHVHAKVVDLR